MDILESNTALPQALILSAMAQTLRAGVMHDCKEVSAKRFRYNQTETTDQPCNALRDMPGAKNYKE